MALALYRKYRPATFAEVVGQEHVTEPLRTALAAGRINHAYLFSGPRGCGKTSSARILARSLNCEQGPTPDPCGVCASCVALAPEGPGSLDVVELDAASHGGVDDTRELRDRAFYVPAESRYRVFIIDEAHMVTSQGFNALLKIVEEPPEHLVFIFATTEPDKVLPTIRSRTHHYPFRLIPPATLRALLEKLCGEEGVTVEPAVYPLVVRAGAGSARDALSVMDQLLAGAGPEGVTYAHAVALLGVTDAALLDEMVDALAASDGAGVFGAVDRVAEAGHAPRRFGVDLLQRLRDLVILQAVPDAVSKGLIDAPEDQLAAMAAQADRLPTATVTRFAEILHTGLTDMRGTTSPRLVLELLCARMLLPAASLSDGALLQRLERVERRLDIVGEPGADGSPGEAGLPSGAGRSGGDGERGSGEHAGGGLPRESGRSGGDGDRGSGENAGGGRPGRGRVGSRAGRAGATASAAPTTPAGKTATAGSPHGGLDLPAPPVLSSDRLEPAAPPPAAPPQAAPHETAPATSPEDAAVVAADPPPTAKAGVDVTDVRRLWPEVLEAAKRQSRSVHALLESAAATAVRVDGGGLYLSTRFPALARLISEPGNTDVLRRALHEIIGVDWRIRCDAGDEPDPSGSRGPTAPSSKPSGGSASASAASSPASSPASQPGAPTPRQSRRPGCGQSDGPASDGPTDDGSAEDDPYDDIDLDAPPAVVQDPEQVAMELLADRLGARRLEQG